jgi:hypothetical protein
MANLKSDGKMIFMIFFGVIIATVLLSSSADQVFIQTNILSISNGTSTAPAVNATLDLTGRTLVGTGIVTNATSGVTVSGGIVQTGLSSTTGLQTIQLTLNDTASAYAAESVNVSYTYQPDGYLGNSGARGISTLIIIIGALAVLIYVIVVLYQNENFQRMLRGIN